MTNPLHANRYADQASQHEVRLAENVPIARDTWRLRFVCPQIARQVVPGQFLMLRAADSNDPLIGRPLAVFDVLPDSSGHASAIDVVYLVKGKLTSLLSRLSVADRIQVWGPLGSGFPLIRASRLILVAGGIGQTPMLTVAKENLGAQTFGEPVRSTGRRADQVILCYGARTADRMAGMDSFRQNQVDVRTATNDGSCGRQALVTALLEEELEESSDDCHVFCCGPEPMMEAVCELTKRYAAPCHVSLETPMACGIGICFSCVAKIRQGDTWDYKRTCVEGPVFDSTKILWE